jgi:hypothetical protein
MYWSTRGRPPLMHDPRRPRRTRALRDKPGREPCSKAGSRRAGGLNNRVSPQPVEQDSMWLRVPDYRQLANEVDVCADV